MSHLKVYYSECSQNEQNRIRKENEVFEERAILNLQGCKSLLITKKVL